MPQAHQPHRPRYKVVHQEQSTELTPQGDRQKMWTVHLEHENGVKGTVELPDDHFTAENVHELASAQAIDVANVAALPDSVAGDPGAGPGQ